MVTLCLNMIVKNESKIITRLLQSVLPIIDTYCICDTGSTDNTIEIITTFFNDHGIKGKIVQEPFKNFCYNRNFAMEAAVGLSDYLLLLDADMILQIGKNFNKNNLLLCDTATLFQGTEEFYYQNLRICKNEGKCKYIGVTHEYLSISNDYLKKTIIPREDLFIIDIGDGGSKSNKYERDIALLEQGIKDEPNNLRYYFYLGNSYHDSGKYNEAIPIYKKRIELGGWHEEVWYSYYRLGFCYYNLKQYNEAICNWLEGYNFYPARIENIYEILKYYRVNSKYNNAKIFYDLAKSIINKKHNIDGFLFLHKDIYTYKIDYEYTLIAAYLGNKNITNQVAHILNTSNDGNINNNVLTNYKFYNNQIQASQKLDCSDKLVQRILGEDIIFNSSSACLLQKEDKSGYYLNIRYVNYEITKTGSYLNCDKYIITINKYVELDNNFKVKNTKIYELEENGRRYMGIEDIKIFNTTNSNIKFIGTGYHLNNKIGIVIGDYNLTKNKLEYNEYTQSFKQTDCEKNWVFFKSNINCKEQIIYSWFPLLICDLDENNKQLIPVSKQPMPKMFRYIRGSSCGFNYNNEIWFITHLVSYESPRWYYNCIVVFDNNMKLLRYTPPFKLDNTPIEYTLSIIVEDDKVIIPYSKWDRETIIGIYDKQYIEKLFLNNNS